MNDSRPGTRWALTLPFASVPLREHRALVEGAEAVGYDDLWSGETSGPDGFTPLALAAAWTEHMRLGTGVVNAFTRGPAVLAQHAAALQDASGGRFCLGIGSSSNVIVERWNQFPFEKPLTKVRETVEVLRAVLAGERGPGGFKLETAPDPPPPIYIAALRGGMLRLGGALGDGTFVNFLPLSNVDTVLAEIRAGEREAGKPEGASDVLCRFFCIPQPADEALPLARWMFAAYATVPVYEQFFRWLGWGEAIDPMVDAWNAGDRAQARELAPEDLIREIFIFGDANAQKERLGEFVARGITTPVLTPICAPDQLPAAIDALAP
ncbi:MAG TPA: LLM class F420-dependent oxidoreductase [Solirubrobacterales bacterium]|nr:LLM class F420-dependent oxidoreductase [Solirubrobacterales bacterium]